MSHMISPYQAVAALTQLWSPQLIAQTPELSVKVARIEGSMGWHTHDNEDKIFMVLQGQLRIEMNDKAIEVRAGEMVVVPKGVVHRPVAEQECQIMFIEPQAA